MDSETFAGSLRDVRAFCEVADCGSLSAAARRLGESKGSVSNRISRLEDKLGVRLLVRTSRAVMPTDEGLAFHARARAGLAMLDEAADSARGQHDIARGPLRITAAVDISINVLPPLIVAFRALHPQITIEILATDTTLDLAANRLDLALRIGVGEPADQHNRTVALASGVIGFYAAPGWITAHALPETPADFIPDDLILSSKGPPGRNLTFVNAAGRKAELRARASVQAGDLATAQRLAEAGAGAAILPDLAAQASVECGRLVRILPEWSVPGVQLHAVTLPGRDLPARVRLFEVFLRDAMRRTTSGIFHESVMPSASNR